MLVYFINKRLRKQTQNNADIISDQGVNMLTLSLSSQDYSRVLHTHSLAMERIECRDIEVWNTFLPTLSSIILFLILALCALYAGTIISAFSVKRRISKEEDSKQDQQGDTFVEERRLSHIYSKLPSKIPTNKSTRKLSRLTSIARARKQKDTQDVTKMLKILVNDKI